MRKLDIVHIVHNCRTNEHGICIRPGAGEIRATGCKTGARSQNFEE